MLKSIYLFSFLGLIMVFSCEKNAQDVKYPDFQQKIVIGSFLSPADTMSYVILSSNNPVFGELNLNVFKTISNAKAFISDGSNEIQMDTFKLGFKFLHRNMPVLPGKNYSIRVEGENGLKAEASCTIPVKHNFNLKIDTISNPFIYPDGYVTSEGFVKVKFTDVVGEANYYIVYVVDRVYENNSVIDSTGKIIEYKKHTLEYELKFKNKLFNDIGKDGQEFELNSDVTHGYWKYSYGDSSFLIFYLLHISKDFYLYQRAIDNYQESQDPFTESIPAYSNVNGGLGIFTGYTKDSVVLRIK
jgi:hypothetical protein